MFRIFRNYHDSSVFLLMKWPIQDFPWGGGQPYSENVLPKATWKWKRLNQERGSRLWRSHSGSANGLGQSSPPPYLWTFPWNPGKSHNCPALIKATEHTSRLEWGPPRRTLRQTCLAHLFIITNWGERKWHLESSGSCTLQFGFRPMSVSKSTQVQCLYQCRFTYRHWSEFPSKNLHKQECIPVGCVPSAAVAICLVGLPQCMVGYTPQVWAWTPPNPPGPGPGHPRWQTPPGLGLDTPRQISQATLWAWA